MKLYEISEQYQKALVELEELDLDKDVISDTLEGIKGDLESKAIAVASFEKNLEAEAVAIKEAIKQMKARQTALENRAKSVHDYLKHNMELNGITEISCPYFKLKIQKNPPSVDVQNALLIPAEFKEEVVTEKIDKAAIKKAGGCEGVEIKQGTRLVIK